jgi:hypothetical protein
MIIDFETVSIRNPDRGRTLLGVDLAIATAIADVLTFIGGLCLPPVGAIVAWHKNWSSNLPALPANWVECNGQTITDRLSPLYSLTIPDLNSANRFLRGNISSGTTGGTKTHTHTTFNQLVQSAAGISMVQGLQSTNHEPPYLDVVWIIRIK